MVQGKPRRQRMTFYNITQDSLDWDWEGSGDGGATWGTVAQHLAPVYSVRAA